MFIKQITIESVEGIDVVLRRTEDGACEVIQNGKRIALLEACDSDAEQFEQARLAAGAICGWVRERSRHIRGGSCMVVNATSSMIHEVLAEMQRIAGR